MGERVADTVYVQSGVCNFQGRRLLPIVHYQRPWSVQAKFGVDKTLEGKALYGAVCDANGTRLSWVLILDNADNLTLFGVGSVPNQTNSLDEFLPHGHTGTVHGQAAMGESLILWARGARSRSLG